MSERASTSRPRKSTFWNQGWAVVIGTRDRRLRPVHRIPDDGAVPVRRVPGDVQCITINETSFFRNEPQLLVFETKILPGLLELARMSSDFASGRLRARRARSPTLAMMMHRTLGVRLADWHRDPGHRHLREASTPRSSPSTPITRSHHARADQRRYFTKNGQNWNIDPQIRSMVNFEVHNLKDRLARSVTASGT